MVFKEKLKATLIGVLIALLILTGAVIAYIAVEGTHTVDTDNFVSVIECGKSVSLEEIEIVDNRTLGMHRIKLEESMIVRMDDTTTAGRKEMVISYGGKEYTVHFEVKYRVDFVADGVTVDSQLVLEASEVILPKEPLAKTGYEFVNWDVSALDTLSGNAVVNAVFAEIEYPSLDGYTATYGDTLGDVKLGSNEHGYWEFLDPAETSVGDVGKKEFGVRFVYYSDATVNKFAYATVDVQKKQFDFSNIVDEFYYDGEPHTPYIEGVETIYGGAANVLVGTYQYTLEIIDDNYFGIYEGTYEIKKPTVTVTVSSAVIAYPAGVPEFTFEVEGFDNVDLLGITINAPSFATQIGEYEIGINYTNENVNYVVHNGTLTVIKGELSVEAPEISEATFEDKLSDIQFLGKYLGTWAWESPETVVDSMDGITAYAIFTHDDPNLNPVRMAIQITSVAKKTLYFNVTDSTFVYEAGKEQRLVFEIVGGLYPDLYKTLTVSGNEAAVDAGVYRRTLVINDSRYEGSVTCDLTVEKARPDVDFSTVYEAVWQENLRLESLTLPEGYAWKDASYRITESGEKAYAVIFTPIDTANYLTVEGEITVKVAKAPLTVAGVLDSYGKTYDTYSFDIKNSGIAAYYTDGELTVKYYRNGVEVDEIINAGEYLLVISVTEGKNYLGATIERVVTVTPAQNDQTVITEQSAVYLGGVGSLLLPENNEGSWSWRESDLGAVGVKTLTAVFTPDENGNYLAREVEVIVTVEKLVLGAPEVSLTLSYNGEAQTLGLVSNELYTVEDNGGKGVGTYTATLTLRDTDNCQWQNGTDTLTFTYEIVPSANEFTYIPEDDASFTYLSSLSTLLATAKYGGVKVEYKRAGAPDSEYSETVPSDVGEYVVRFTTTDTNCVAILTETRAFSITPLGVNAPTILNPSLQYNGREQTATLVGLVDGIYSVTDTGVTNVGDVGTVTLTIYNSNYVFSDGSTVVTLTYTVAKAGNAWIVDPDISETVTYGDTPKVSGQATYDSVVTYYRSLGSSDEFILGLPSVVGTYEIKITTSGENAVPAEERYFTLVVTKRAIDLPTASLTLVYNGNEQIGVGAPTAQDELFGVYTVTGGTGKNAGDYVATATLLNHNYKWATTDKDSVEISYTIKKAVGVIILDKTDYELTYSGEDLFDLVKGGRTDNIEQTSLTYTVTSFVKHDGTSLAADTILGAGRYVVTVTSDESDNYLGASVTFTVTVNKVALTVPTVADKVYTGSVITVEVESTDKYTVTGDVSALEVGEYTVTFTLTDSDNYEWLGADSSASVSRSYRIGTAVNSWVVEPEDITAVYNGKSVTVAAQALHGEITVVYTLNGVEVSAPTSAGVYTVVITARADNYADLVAYRTIVINKATVDAPTPDTLTYNGTEQKLSFTDLNLGKLYTVVSETGATNVGESATATLKLTDSTNYRWSTTSEVTLTLSVTVAKAGALLNGAPTVSDWTFGDAETLPVSSLIPSQSQFEGVNIVLLYAYGEGAEFVSYAELQKTDGKLRAGTYYVKARVLDTDNFTGCESEVTSFTVAKQKITVPTAAGSLVFNGNHHNSGITSTALYTVTDEGGIDAGTYYAYLTLADSTNYEWQGEKTVTATVSYSVAKYSFTDAGVDLSGREFEYSDLIGVNATFYSTIDSSLFFSSVKYYYSANGSEWFDAPENLAASLGVDYLNTGSYFVKIVIAESDNFNAYEKTETFTVVKKILALPTDLTLTYNGSEQTAIAAGNGYTVTGGIALGVGDYKATLTLTDKFNYKWADTDLESVEVSYSVIKAENSWTVAPELTNDIVLYNDYYTVLGASLYDTVKYKYRNTADSEYTFIDSIYELPTAVGSYEIVIYTESVNAEPLSATFYLTITRKPVEKPNSLPNFVYDGSVKTHNVTAGGGLVIRSSTDAVNAGETVSVTVGLLDSNYVWTDGTTADYTLTSTVKKATIAFGAVSVSDVEYTKTPSPTVNIDKSFATSLIGYVYSVDKVNYYTLAELTVGGYLPVGDYWVKAYVSGDNVNTTYSSPTSFKVTKVTPDSISVSWGSSPSSGGLYYQNLLTLNEGATTVTYGGVKVEVLSYTYEMKGTFAGSDTVYTVTAIFKDSNTYNNASFDVTVPLKTVATIGHGGTPYGTIKDAVENALSGNVVWVIPDTTGNVVIKGTLEIPSGVTLRLPYGTGSSDYNTNQKSTLNYDSNGLDEPAEKNSSLYLKTYVRVAAGGKIVVRGTLDIAGELSGGGYSTTYQDYAGHTARYYALLELETGCTLDIYGTVYALGYIRETEEGKSAVYVNAGGSLNQPFVLRDFRTGNYIKAATSNPEYSPFTRFILMNVSPKTTIYAGGKAVGYANLWAGSNHNHVAGNIVGADSSAFVQLTAGRLVCKYDIDSEIMHLDFYGGAVLNEFKLSAGGLVGQVSSKDFPLAFTYHLDVTLHREEGQTEDAVYTMGKSGEVYKMLPGAKLTVEEGVILNVSTLNIYDSTFVEDIKKVNKSDHSVIISTIKCYPTGKGDAILTVRGTLVAKNLGGKVHTDTDGAKITVTDSVSVSNREITKFYEDTLSSTAVADIVVTNTLKLYYDGTLVRGQVIVNTEYVSSSADKNWNYTMPEIVEVQLQDGYGVYTDFAVYTDENGEIYIGTFDSRATKDNPDSIRVLKGATVTYYLTKNQLFSEKAASSVTVTSLDDIHSGDYTKDWSASSTSPVIYNVKAITVSGTGVGKITEVSIVYNTSTGNADVTLKSAGSGLLSSGQSFSVNGKSATSSGFIFKSYTYTTSVTADITLDVV